MVAAYNDVLDVTCKYCNITYQILANRDDLDSWVNGEGYIQDILAYLSAGERELLISGICNNCWKILYPEVDNDEE